MRGRVLLPVQRKHGNGGERSQKRGCQEAPDDRNGKAQPEVASVREDDQRQHGGHRDSVYVRAAPRLRMRLGRAQRGAACNLRRTSGFRRTRFPKPREELSRTASILGCGYLGLSLASELVRRGWQVRGSTTTPAKLSRLREADVEPFLIRVPEDVADKPRFFGSDVLVLNIPPGRRRPDVEEWFGKAVDAVLMASLRGGVRFLLFASSTSVNAPQGPPLLEEDAGKLAPPTASGRALLRAASGFDTTVLRFAGLYGYERAPGRFARRVIKRGDLPVNLVHRDDPVAAMLAVLEHDIRKETFNVCAEEHPSRAAFYRRAAGWLGLPPPRAESGTRRCTSV